MFEQCFSSSANDLKNITLNGGSNPAGAVLFPLSYQVNVELVVMTGIDDASGLSRCCFEAIVFAVF